MIFGGLARDLPPFAPEARAHLYRNYVYILYLYL